MAAECVKRIESGKYDVVILNFANCDMVGHTGVFDAAVKAVEAVDVYKRQGYGLSEISGHPGSIPGNDGK